MTSRLLIFIELKGLDDLEELLNKKFGEFRASPLTLEHKPDKGKGLQVEDEINKISEKYARKPYQKMLYYPRPTPQDVLIEEQDNDHYHQGYSGSDIYEWNIDGLAERQIYTTVHRMLMYSTICKVNKNSDRAIAEMIIAVFTD
ncbi:hypothetical protein A4A49_51864 [Nicotiana attenuata]|uniref:DUF7746 domain-containing protein n=1 Tax=Nicotiana attenuata TaxID=49451 RepID=A0A314L116_NICAT|nr:hypothetical protein A4A49_51864 [Nicotiana attenuata]